MNFFTFMDSAASLYPYFEACARAGQASADRPAPETFAALRPLGCEAEGEMLDATGGVNTHKGAIFSIGIACAALGRLERSLWGDPARVLQEIAAMTAGLTERDFAGVTAENAVTAGQKLYLQYGITGVRGQVEAGLPAVRDYGLPALENGLAQGYDLNRSGCGALLNQIITHLIEVQCARGNLRLFLYTKAKSAKFFGDLGFYEIARVEDTLVFMENRRDGFGSYLRELEKTKTGGRSAALVMNANPFTLGHQYLVETAAAACDTLHLFVVSEDASLVPFAVRKKLVAEGVKHLPNVILHDSGPYIISNATFPSYFLKDEAAVIDGHARLDLAVFTRIAKALNITARYVGEEPTSQVTGLYNQIMCEQLPKAGIDCIVVPRKEANGRAISASTVRQCLQTGDWDTLETLLPRTTLDYFRSQEAALVLERIRKAGNVVHY